MPFEETLRKNLSPELYTQVMDQLGDDFDFDLVPRSRLNTVIKQRNELRKQVAGVAQPQDGQRQEGEGESDDLDQIKQQLQKQYSDQAAAAIAEVKIQYAALEKLRAANAVDPELLWSSNAIDKTKLSLDKSGSLVGLDDIITQLKQAKPAQFKKADEGAPSGTGKKNVDEFEGVTTKEDFLKLDADKQIAFKQANPTIFKTFMSAT